MIFYDISNVERDNKIIDGIDGIDGIDEWEGRFVNDRMESGGHNQDLQSKKWRHDLIYFCKLFFFTKGDLLFCLHFFLNVLQHPSDDAGNVEVILDGGRVMREVGLVNLRALQP